MIVIGNIKKLNTYDLDSIDEIWYIVRSIDRLPNCTGKIVLHVPELSPSSNLFYKYLNLKKNFDWNGCTFKDIYVPQFIEEMKLDTAKTYLNKLFRRAQTSNILLLCFCDDETLCHRSIILGLEQGANEHLNKKILCGSLDAGNVDYSYYYDMWRN